MFIYISHKNNLYICILSCKISLIKQSTMLIKLYTSIQDFSFHLLVLIIIYFYKINTIVVNFDYIKPINKICHKNN